MSRTLAELLGKPEHHVAEAVAKLEELSGYTSEDVRLIAEVKQDLRTKIAQLGLDPDDTSPQELYQALQARLHADLRHINRHLKPGITGEELLEQLMAAVRPAVAERQVWALKAPKAKAILRANPPNRLMHQLNYRSQTSMLKREPPALLLAGALSVESATWQKKFWQQLKEVTAADFEDRPLQILAVTHPRWQALAPRGALVTLVPQMGAAAVWPPPAAAARAGLGLNLFVFQAADILQAMGSRLKLCQLEPDFGKSAVKMWRGGRLTESQAGPLALGWRAICRHFSRQSAEALPGWLGPHLQAADLYQRPAAIAAAELWPRLQWWSHDGHLALQDESIPVSLSILDALHNYLAAAPFGRHTAADFQGRLWDKLISRYLAHPAAEAYAMSQLADSREPEFNSDINIDDNQSIRELARQLQEIEI